MNRVTVRLLLTWLLCVVAGTLAPFDFSTEFALQHGLKMFELGPHGDPIHFALNVLLFVPLGVLLHHETRRRSVSLPPILIAAGIAGISISLTIEYLQALLPTRDSSLIDVLANTAGALIGVAADRSWGTSAKGRFAQLRGATSTAMLGGLIGSFLVVALLISGTLQAGSRLSNWSSEYPLVIGNEHTGDRPWRGRVFALDITDAATPAASVRRFAAGESVVLSGAPIAAFVFNGNPPYRDTSGNLPGLEWTRRPDAADQTGAEWSGHSWLRSEGPASGLAQRLRKTNAFTLRVHCETDDTNQDGPARIISNSLSPSLRNFTLGQQGGDLVLRLRTPDTGVNGYPLEIDVPGVFAERRAREILVTYDGATLLVAMAHGDEVSSTKLTPGASLALAVPPFHVRPHELPLYEMAYVGALSLVPGVLIVLLGHTTRQRRLFSVAWVVVFPVLLEATTTQVSGGSFDWADVATAAGAGAVVLVLLKMILSGADVPWQRSARDRAGIARPDALGYPRSSGATGTTFQGI